MSKEARASMAEGFWDGGAHGSVATKLLANDMNPECLRSLATLRDYEWEAVDEVVVTEAKKRMPGVDDLIQRGLVKDLGNELAETTLKWEVRSGMEAAEMAMNPMVSGEKDRLDFTPKYLPLPITFKDFNIDIRTLNTSRRMGTPLNTDMAAEAGFVVGEKIEETLFNGASSYYYDGGYIYGYTDFPQRTTRSFGGGEWDSSADGADILADVRNMIQDAHNDRHHGPFILYIPTAYQMPLWADHKAASDVSIWTKIMELDEIEAIKVSDHLTADNVVLVEMDERTVRMVIALQEQVIEWNVMGGLGFEFKALAIKVPQIRADYNDRSGIVHLS